MARPLEISWEPVPAPGLDEKAEEATWARLTINVHGPSTPSVILTRVQDRYARVVRDGVYGTVLPLAEWLVQSWLYLTESAKTEPADTASPAERYDWTRTHRWRHAGEGTALPGVRFSPVDPDTIEVRAFEDSEADAPPYERVLFTNAAAVRADRRELTLELERFVQSVVDTLGELAPEDPRTQDLLHEWSVVSDKSSPERRPRALAARIGIAWWDLEEADVQKLRLLSESDLDIVTEHVLDAAAWSDLDVHLRAARELWKACGEASGASSDWLALRGSIAGTPVENGRPRPPWELGWGSARRLRAALGRAQDERVDLDEIEHRVRPEARTTTLDTVDSVVAWRSGLSPIRAMPAGGTVASWHRRFALARDLHPLLFQDDPRQDHATVFSKRIAGVASVANAFGTELLVPVDLLRRRLAGVREIDDEGIADLARELDAPFRCVLHQVTNHELARLV